MRGMRTLPWAALAVSLAACGGPTKPTPDAGPDTSCGLDCVAQTAYGLIIERCFEYSADPTTASQTPSLGVWVRPVFTLEGNVPAIPVEYRQNGQILGTDYFAFQGSDLVLLRRIAAGASVTYRTGDAITGVKWLSLGTAAGENFTTNTQAFLSSDNTLTATQYRVTTAAPTTSEKRTPLATYDDAVKLLFGETPDHGADPRRVFVEGTGFTIIASPFNLAGGTPTPAHLQRIRDIGTPDAGADSCSLGEP